MSEHPEQHIGHTPTPNTYSPGLKPIAGLVSQYVSDMIPDPDGSWVPYQDHAHLLSENAALRERGETLRKRFCEEFCMQHEVLPTSHVPECESFRDVILGSLTLTRGKR